jgi:hypothetical protein
MTSFADAAMHSVACYAGQRGICAIAEELLLWGRGTLRKCVHTVTVGGDVALTSGFTIRSKRKSSMKKSKRRMLIVLLHAIASHH